MIGKDYNAKQLLLDVMLALMFGAWGLVFIAARHLLAIYLK